MDRAGKLKNIWDVRVAVVEQMWFLWSCCVLLLMESPLDLRSMVVTGLLVKNRSARDVPTSSKFVLLSVEIFFPHLYPSAVSLHSSSFASSLFSFPIFSTSRLIHALRCLLFLPFSLHPLLIFCTPLCLLFFSSPLFSFPIPWAFSHPLSPHLLSVYRQACTTPPAVIYSA